MKITSLSLFKWNGENQDPCRLAAAQDLSNFGYFERSTVKEMLVFVSRTIVKRTQPGQRQSVQHNEYICHVTNRNGLAAIVFVDREYPVRSAFSVLQKVTDDYIEMFKDSWRTQTTDSVAGDEMAAAAVQKYQDPAQADKLLQIQRELDETKIVLHKTIDSVLARGEKLDTLVEKSSDLSMASQMFYKQARKTNSCCGMM